AFDAEGIGPAARAARGKKGRSPFPPRAKPAPNASSPSRYPLAGSAALATLEGFFQKLIDAGYMCSPAPSRYALSLEGLLRCDAIGAEILALME
ncbi:MAG: hypothetical protein LBF21_00410, partial [Puniceicoccales bacterium]|nr:hypothetical protein [Puniceicoccales bacterium]